MLGSGVNWDELVSLETWRWCGRWASIFQASTDPKVILRGVERANGDAADAGHDEGERPRVAKEPGCATGLGHDEGRIRKDTTAITSTARLSIVPDSDDTQHNPRFHHCCWVGRVPSL